MIQIKQPDGWIVFLADDGETELFRFLPPPSGLTAAELEQFVAYLKREAERKEVGPS